MLKLLTRIVAFLLVPCLVADSSSAFGISQLQVPSCNSHISAQFEALTEQALPAPLCISQPEIHMGKAPGNDLSARRRLGYSALIVAAALTTGAWTAPSGGDILSVIINYKWLVGGMAALIVFGIWLAILASPNTLWDEHTRIDFVSSGYTSHDDYNITLKKDDSDSKALARDIAIALRKEGPRLSRRSALQVLDSVLERTVTNSRFISGEYLIHDPHSLETPMTREPYNCRR